MKPEGKWFYTKLPDKYNTANSQNISIDIIPEKLKKIKEMLQCNI